MPDSSMILHLRSQPCAVGIGSVQGNRYRKNITARLAPIGPAG
jgi:hypothetical protein